MSRVVFVNRYFYPDESATAQLLSDLAFGLAEHGFDVHVVCSRQLYGAPEAQLPAEEAVRGVVIHRVWTTRFGRRRLLGRALDYVSFYITCAVELLGLLRRRDVVIAKTDPPLISIVAALAARLRGAVLVNWLQDVFPEVASQLAPTRCPRP
jgi:colanic acid biosynthesis glycosyl transferase WcaI